MLAKTYCAVRIGRRRINPCPACTPKSIVEQGMFCRAEHADVRGTCIQGVGYKWNNFQSWETIQLNSMFYSCYSLRIPNTLVLTRLFINMHYRVLDLTTRKTARLLENYPSS